MPNNITENTNHSRSVSNCDLNIARRCIDFIQMNMSDDEEPYSDEEIPDRVQRVLTNLQTRNIQVWTKRINEFDVLYRGEERIVGLLNNQIILCLTTDAIKLLEVDEVGMPLMKLLNLNPDDYHFIQGKIEE